MTATPGITVLLGAGASVEAGVPVSADLTRKIAEAIDRKRYGADSKVIKALHVAIGAMTFHDTAEGRGAFDGIDVERLFSAIQMLGERDSLEIAPFVGSWNKALDSVGEDTRFPSFFKKHFLEALESNFDSEFERLFTDAVKVVAGKGNGSQVFQELERRMVNELRGCLAVAPGSSDYLAPLLNISGQPIRIATLNYDRTVELMSERWGASISTGVELWTGGLQWDWHAGVDIQLLKLHGSLNWYVAGWTPGEGRLSEKRIAVSDDFDDDAIIRGELGVVFGQRGKLRSDGPFQAMLAGFDEMLSSTEHLVVVGYSFRDAHINDAMRRWFNRADEPQVTIINPMLTDLSYWVYRDKRTFLAELLRVMTSNVQHGRRYELMVNSPHEVSTKGAGVALTELFGEAPRPLRAAEGG